MPQLSTHARAAAHFEPPRPQYARAVPTSGTCWKRRLVHYLLRDETGFNFLSGIRLVPPTTGLFDQCNGVLSFPVLTDLDSIPCTADTTVRQRLSRGGMLTILVFCASHAALWLRQPPKCKGVAHLNFSHLSKILASSADLSYIR